jgi:TonB family protein
MSVASLFLIATAAATPLPGGAIVAGSISDRDYPKQARNNGIQGSTTAALTVDPKGRVVDCSIEDSSGSTELDQATCRIITKRFRFRKAAKREAGKSTAYSWKWSWRISDPCPRATSPNDVCIRIERR